MAELPTYEETLDYLYGRLPLFSRIGAAALRGGLDNIRALCRAMGEPQQRFPTVHVAGTNGKGSVSHMLAAVLQAAGHRTGLYTSPHLLDFRERIRLQGHMIPREAVVSFVARHRSLVESLDPSFFEISVAMAFSWFAQQQADVAVIEVGLGGRLDSTNIIVPALSVITNISMDHQALLGQTLAAIAGEKAGIIKPAVPIVVGETLPETAPVFRKQAAALGAPLGFADQERELLDQKPAAGGQAITLRHGQEVCTYQLDLGGRYQARNLLTLLSAVDRLRAAGWHIPEEALRKGLAAVRHLTGLGGRWQVIAEHPYTVADVAHNPAGIAEVLQQAKAMAATQLHLVTGFVRDKDVQTILSLMPPEARYYFCAAAVPRALPSAELQDLAAGHGLQGAAYGSVAEALEAARKAAGPDDMILICGSVFIVSEVL